MRMGPVIDVIIPCYKPARRLLDTVDRLRQQTVPVRTIRLLDTLSDSGISGIDGLLHQEGVPAETWFGSRPEVIRTAVPKNRFDHGGTRNLGAELSADADYLLFMTQDALPVDGSLTDRLLQGFRFSEGEDASVPVAAVYARQLPEENALCREKLSREFNYPPASALRTQRDFPGLGIRTYFCSNVCAMYDAAVYRKLGGFIRRTIFNEDMIFTGHALQSGFAVRYEADAEVVHSHNYSAVQQFRRNFDLGVSQADHPEIFAAARSEGEGRKYVGTMTGALRKNHASGEIPGFIVQCGFRLIGYRLGKNYRHIPMALIRRWTMNPEYWKETQD